ncbi:MAG: hypothetical protein IID54_00325 [Proteobacteria bacterium]|nr:hypothetical protein [Pseudomonadota bacterium]
MPTARSDFPKHVALDSVPFDLTFLGHEFAAQVQESVMRERLQMVEHIDAGSACRVVRKAYRHLFARQSGNRGYQGGNAAGHRRHLHPPRLGLHRGLRCGLTRHEDGDQCEPKYRADEEHGRPMFLPSHPRAWCLQITKFGKKKKVVFASNEINEYWSFIVKRSICFF